MAKDDPVLNIIRFIPQHEVVQKYGVILPDYLTNQAMKESEAYKTYYDLATGKVALKPKYVRRSTRKKTNQAPQDAPALSKAEQMKIAIKRSKTQLQSSHANGSGANEGTSVSPGVPDVPTDGSEDEQISWKSSDEDDDEEVSISKDDDDNADDQDDDDQEYDGQDDEGQDEVNEQTKSDNDGDDFVHPKFSIHDQEERQMKNKQEEGSDLRFEDRVKALEDDFSEFKQTNQFSAAVSLILSIVDTYLSNKMNEAVKTTIQLQSDRLRDEAQAENEDFINKLDNNIKKIIKEQTVNEQLEAEVLTRSSNEAKTSHAVAANLSELELKKILIDKMESNKSIHQSD
ncbi:hypothetical protein Tco_0880186 [Tanacetum coccineum]